jgi:uncharacterized protein YjlB
MGLKPVTFTFADDGLVPNNALPVVIYEGALDLARSEDPAAAIEALFRANGWGRDMWRDGVYPFVHYHAMIHEALGIARGRARVQLGGHRGQAFDLKAGDVAILPAGTGTRSSPPAPASSSWAAIRRRGPTLSAAVTTPRNVIKPCRRSRACRCRGATRCSARAAA